MAESALARPYAKMTVTDISFIIRSEGATMPAIFSEKQKQALRNQLLTTGFELLKQYGYRKMTVEDLTKRCAIAKGTFYRFFKSKEDFVYEIMIHERDAEKASFLERLDERGVLTKDSFRDYVKSMMRDSSNIFSYMSQEEIALLRSSWPDEYFLNVENDEKTSLWLLSFIPDKAPEVDWRVFANYMKAIAIVGVHKPLLNPDTADAFLDRMIDDMIRYVWVD